MIGLMIAAAVSANGAFFTGNDLYAKCTDAATSLVCTAYIMGVSDTVDMFQDAKVLPDKLCTSSLVTAGQQRDVVIAYLRDHPATRDRSAASIVVVALTDAFPCH